MLVYKINVLAALKAAGYNSTRILKEGLINQTAVQKMRRGEMIGIRSLERVCDLLDCQPGDIIENRKETETMRKYFCETGDYSVVMVVDSQGRAVAVEETAFDEPLTLEVARAADYSNFDGCRTAREAAANYTGEVVEFKPDEFDRVTEF